MTITEALNEIAKKRRAMAEKIEEVKEMDNEFQKWLHDTIGINEKAPVSPESILLMIEKFMPKDK